MSICLSHCGREGDRTPITFYAIYYQSDYAFTGSVQTFTAPVSSIYEFELWGSPGGSVREGFKYSPGGKGGYTKFYIHLDVATGLYCFVGGSGVPVSGNSSLGGWNGGGKVTTCTAGPHAGSGGGMTHVSLTNNPASDSEGNPVSYWNPDGTIGVAGGGGGGAVGGAVGSGGDGGGQYAGNGQYDSRWKGKHFPQGATEWSGYKQGVGEDCVNSGAAGGGWYGGFSTGQTVQTQGGRCGGTGGGGSGHICEAGKQTKYSHLNECLAGYENIPVKPNADDADKGRHGYIRITLYERD